VTPALIIGIALLLSAATLRLAGSSLVRCQLSDALREQANGRRGAATVARLLERPDAIQPSVGLVHVVLVAGAAVTAGYVLTVLTTGAGTFLALFGLILAVALIGDWIPRLVGRSRPGLFAYRAAPILAPIVGLGSRVADYLVRRRQSSVDIGADEEPADDEEELISSVLEFGDTIVREVMVPRTDMVTVSAATPIVGLRRLVVEHGFSRLPVVGENADDVRGLVMAKDLLAEGPVSVSSMLRPIDFVPETKKVAELLSEMRSSKSHMAIVVDEFGGTAGLVTIEDLLEELVGEIVDEYDEDEPAVAEAATGGWLVDGRLGVDDLSEVVGVELPDEEWDTVGGLVLAVAGRVPDEQETFDWHGLTFVPTKVQGRRVAQVLVTKS